MTAALAETIRGRYEAGITRPPLLHGDGPVAGVPVPAAVLVAIVDRPEPGLILTKRNEALRKHPGQVAFAGGRADPDDAGPVETALREAWEEIDLVPEAVTVIGEDAPYRTGTGFSIIPVVGVVPPGLPLNPREFEVADIFEVPLDHVLDPANHRRAEAMFQGKLRRYYEIFWEDRRIWGATAGMIVNLSRWLRG